MHHACCQTCMRKCQGRDPKRKPSSRKAIDQPSTTAVGLLRGHRRLHRYAVTALWGISAYFGDKVALTQAGHLLGHVRDAKSRIRVGNRV